MALENVSISFNLPGIEVGTTWTFDAKEKAAAWELYVELVTRISVARLGHNEGGLREALSSYHSLFATTRDILRKYGPDVARPKGPQQVSLGYLALWMLNGVVRPLLAEWHPRLLHHESLRPLDIPPVEHEQLWAGAAELRRRLDEVATELTKYARVFEVACGIPILIPEKLMN